MIPESVLRKMRAALLVAGAAGCTRPGSPTPDASAKDVTDANTDDASADAGIDQPDASADDASAEVGEGGADGGVIACPFHPEGHAVLPDGGVQQAKVEDGLSHVGGIGTIGGLHTLEHGCPGCGMGGPRPWVETPQADVQIIDVSGVSDDKLTTARRLMAGQRPGMRACYNNGLKLDPSQEGTLLVTIVWGSNGDVKTVTTNSNSSNIQPPTATCIASRLRHIVNTKDLAGATISLRLRFVNQR